MTKREEFDRFMGQNCCVSELGFVIAVCHKSDERMQDMMDYITHNQLQCKDMIQDGECTVSGYQKYANICDRASLYEGIVVDYSKYKKKAETDSNRKSNS